MIERINKINNLGVFNYFDWDVSTPNFVKYNLIYGWNGCGKSTLAHLFAILNEGKSSKFPNAEYEMETDNGKIKNSSKLNTKIRVFDQDYIKRHINIIECKATPILILGEENKLLSDQIRDDEKELSEREKLLVKLNSDKEKLKNQRDKTFTTIASAISMSIGGNLSRTYRRPDAEKKFASLKNKTNFTNTAISQYQQVLKQDQKDLVTPLTLTLKNDNGNEISLGDYLKNIETNANILLASTVQTRKIQRLKENLDISNWVETGIQIHNEHNSISCEYCKNIISSERQSELQTHFNEEDKLLKSKIDILISEINIFINTIKSLTVIDKANLYIELQTNYQVAIQGFQKKRDLLVSILSDINEQLTIKKGKTSEKLLLAQEGIQTDLDTCIAGINEVINKHNHKTEDFASEKLGATTAIESHFLSTIYDEVINIDDEIKLISQKIEIYTNGGQLDDNQSIRSVEDIKEQIKVNKAIVSSEHKACEQINQYLSTFLGRDELIFEVQPGGYVIKRNGHIASNLSEGEKTAIGIIYFITHLKDQEFNISDGIIVIDDPISSLDSNSLFQAFALLKNSVKTAKQLFILTHNFEFLRLIINWFKYAKTSYKFFMIKNSFINRKRCAFITELDKLLIDHESEYNYLFKRLYKFESDGTLESVYDIPNLARKVLETFLMFMVPNNQSPYSKLELIDFDENKKTSIYKFTNDQSHITGKGFDPSLVSETQKNVVLLLEMIKEVFPSHFKVLEQSVSQ